MPENAYSGDIAAPVWQQAVAGALADRAPQAFQAPDGVVFGQAGGA
ncbi:hypothetical protein [Deinococcus peraridilitoris]